jgi:hypothetical protein
MLSTRRHGLRSTRLLLAIALGLPALGAGAQELPRPAELPGAPSFEALLERTRAYLDEYAARFGGVIAVERYVQTEWHVGRIKYRRELLSDLLMARVPGLNWVSYRDVAEVDGKPVRDRQNRLERLLREAPKGGDAVASRYAKESARYNIGTIQRTVNVPTAALLLLDRVHAEEVVVTSRSTEPLDGRLAAVLHVEEIKPGVLVRSGRGYPGRSEADFWIDPGSGAVRRSELTVDVGLVRARLGVGYREVPALGMLLPAEMREAYYRSTGTDSSFIDGVATYEKFLRPEVTMQEWVKP